MARKSVVDILRVRSCRESVRLLKKTIALKVTRSESKARAIEFAELPSGAAVEICGQGLNDQTLTVHWNRTEYLVFTQDLGVA